MQTKNAKNNNFEDSKYCYVILRKGQRPKPSIEITSTNADQPSLNVDNERGVIQMHYYKMSFFLRLIVILFKFRTSNRFNS